MSLLRKNKQAIGVLELLLTALIWGTAFVAQSVGMEHIGPYTFNAARFFVGGLVLIPIVLVIRKTDKQERTPQEKRLYRKNTIIGGSCCGVILCAASTFQQIGIQYTTVGKAGFITALYIIIVPLLGLFLKKKVTWLVWFSTIIAVIGFYLLSISGKVSMNKGDVAVLICAVLFSVHILVVDYFSPKADGVGISCIQFWISAIISAGLMFLFENPQMQQILASAKPILYAGIMSCGVAYTLQIIGQKHVEPTIASLLMSLESVFSVLAGWVLLGQVLSVKELIGCCLVFTAVILAQIPVPQKLNKNR